MAQTAVQLAVGVRLARASYQHAIFRRFLCTTNHGCHIIKPVIF